MIDVVLHALYVACKPTHAVIDDHDIGIEAVDQFARTKKIRANMIPERLSPERLPEERVKQGLVKLLGETEVPKDWGGLLKKLLKQSERLYEHPSCRIIINSTSGTVPWITLWPCTNWLPLCG